MKWINGYTAEEKDRRWMDHRENWHEWFAWYPVTVGITGDQRKVKVWLSKVKRKGTVHPCPYAFSSGWEWEYKEK